MTKLKKRLAVNENTQMVWRIIAAFDSEDISKVLYSYGMQILEAKNIKVDFNEKEKWKSRKKQK